jgi:hypothetical protein
MEDLAGQDEAERWRLTAEGAERFGKFGAIEGAR